MSNDSEVKIILPRVSREINGMANILIGSTGKVMIRQNKDSEWFELGYARNIDLSIPADDCVIATVEMLVSEFEVESE